MSDPDHDAANITSPKNHEVESTYDTVGRQILSTSYADDGHRIITGTGYDELGEKVTATDAVGNLTRYAYDALGNLVSVTLPAVPNALNGNALTSPIYKYTYDAEAHLLTQTDPDTHTTTFSYDPEGNRLTRSLPGGETESWTYDALGRMATHTDFDGHVAAYIYDDSASLPTAEQTKLGRLVEEQRFANAASYAAYLAAIAAHQTAVPDERTHTFYDALGRRSSVDEYSGSTQTRHETFTYDPITGGITQDAAPEGTVNHAFDPATGRLIKTYTNYNDTRYRYDDLGRLAFVDSYQLNGGTLATTLAGAKSTGYTYDLAGNLKSVTTPGGVKTSYFYDGMNRLTDEQVNDGGNNLLAEFAYTLRDDGLRSGVVEQQRSSGTGAFSTTALGWSYDSDGRLTREVRDVGNNGLSTADDEADVYGMDLAGNRIYKDVFYGGNAANAPDPATNVSRGTPDGSVASTYNADDQLLTETATFTGSYAGQSYTTIYGQLNGTDVTGGYDADGSLKESHRTNQDGSTVDSAYAYDLRNRLATAATTTTPYGGSPTATNTSYGYDADGNRVSETTNGVATYFVNDLANPTGYSQTLEEKTAAGDSHAPTRSYVIGQDVIAQSDATNGTLDLEYDGHGSTRALILDATGQVATGQIFAYDAYGNRKDANQPIAALTSLLYTGERFDTGINKYNWRGRVYDAATGTWPQRDPVLGDPSTPLTLHKYLYANGEPVNRLDPSGLFSYTELVITGGIIGALGGFLIGGAIGWHSSGHLLSAKTFEYGVIGAAVGFGVGASAAAILGYLMPELFGLASTPVSSGAAAAITKTTTKIVSQAIRLGTTGSLGAQGSKLLISFVAGLGLGIYAGVKTPNAFSGVIDLAALASYGGFSTLPVLVAAVYPGRIAWSGLTLILKQA